MKAVLYILMATAMTYATAASAGYLLARAFRLKLERFVEWVAGSAILSGLVFLLAAAGLARRGVFVALSALLVSSALAAGLRERHRAAGGVSRQGLRRLSLGLPPAWAAAFWVVYLAFGWLYLSQALSPETSADALAYHTGLVARYAAEHRIFPIRTTFYASFPGAVEMLFLFAFSIGRYSAASMVEFLFLALAPFGILSWARRAGHPVAGVVGALLFYASPVVGRDGTVAYVDVAAAGIAFALFCALQQWRNERTLRLAAFAGLLAGFGAATKYTQCVGLLYGLGMLAFCLGRRPKALARTAAAFCAAALVMAGPWLVKNALFVANPVSPFFNRLFPNPYVYPSFETDYSQALRNLNGVTPAQYPLEAAVYGGRLDGFAGPVFLLAPLALLALRRSAGRQTLAAAAVYLAPCVAAISVRLMIPALLFIALALALAVERKTAVAALLLAVHAVTCWPAVAGRYAHGAWRIEAANWPAALRRVPEEDYLRSRLPDYDIWTAVRAYVPPGARVLASIDNRAYQPRELIVPYESALGNRLGDAVNQVLHPGLRPTRRFRYDFPPRRVRRVRLALVDCGGALWAVGEVRVFRDGAELARRPEWRLLARPNPWDVQLAFDNSPVTLWSARQYHADGAFLQIDLGREEAVDALAADLPADLGGCRMRLEIEGSPGRWTRLGASETTGDAPYLGRYRRAVAEELMANGVGWMITEDGRPLAADLLEHFPQWGARNVAYRNGFRLWRLE